MQIGCWFARQNKYTVAGGCFRRFVVNGISAFGFVAAACGDRTLHTDRAACKVNVAPAQADYLTATKPQSNSRRDRYFDGFAAHMPEQITQFLDRVIRADVILRLWHQNVGGRVLSKPSGLYSASQRFMNVAVIPMNCCSFHLFFKKFLR